MKTGCLIAFLLALVAVGCSSSDSDATDTSSSGGSSSGGSSSGDGSSGGGSSSGGSSGDASSGGTSPDGGSDGQGTDNLPTVDAPPVPSVTSGEIAVTVRDKGNDTTFRCASGSDPANAVKYQTNKSPTTDGPMVDVDIFDLQCKQGDSPTQNQKAVVIQVVRTKLGTGKSDISTMLPGSSNVVAEGTSMLVQVIDDGEGISGSFNGNAGMTQTGVLTLDSIGDGGSIRGSIVAEWKRMGVVTGGVTQNTEDREGSLAIAFDWPSN